MKPLEQFSRRARVLRTGLCCLVFLTGGPSVTSAGTGNGGSASVPELLWPISVNIPMDIAHLVHQEDTATVLLRIDVDGAVIDWVGLDLPHYRLAPSIGHALETARFSPGAVGGEPVIFDMKAVIPVGEVGYYGVLSINGLTYMEGKLSRIGGSPFRLTQSSPQELDQPLEMVSEGQPRAFKDDKGEIVSGKVNVEFYVDQAGLPRIVRPDLDADPRLHEVAMLTVQQFRFKPVTRHGRPTVVKARIEIEF
jgi:hypothetical protein